MTGSDAAPPGTHISARKDIYNNWGWYLLLGITSCIAGLLAIAFPLVASIAIKILIGWLLLLIGISQILQAFSARKWRNVIVDFLLGLLLLVAGGILAIYPLTGLIALTLFLAILFVLQGILQIALSLQLKSVDGWGWILFSGIIAVAIGILLGLELPSSASWALGLLAGINMIVSGVGYIALALTARRSRPAA